MLADKALRDTFRNFSTLFLATAAVTITCHLVYGFLFRDVLEIDELHHFVSGLKAGRTVNGVGRKDLDEAIMWAKVVPLVELLLLPLVIGATRRVMSRDRAGEVPTAIDALRHPRSGHGLSLRLKGAEWAAVIAGLALGAGAWYLSRQAGLLIMEPFPNPANFALFSLVYGVAEALGLALALGCFVSVALLPGSRRA